MSGYESRVVDVINQAAPTFATVAVSQRGLSHFVDPSMTGVTRFMQKSGFPFPLLTPQMAADLSTTATAGSKSATILGTRLLPWLTPGLVLSFDLVETVTVESYSVLDSGNIQLFFLDTIRGDHQAGSRMYIRAFTAYPADASEAGLGGLGEPAAILLSPFILVPGDVVTINGLKRTLLDVNLSAPNTYEVKTVEDDGFPEMATDTDVIVTATAAYQSAILNVPHLNSRSSIQGPVVLDWVSGPMVADYNPKPESTAFIEEFDAAANRIAIPRQITKNDTLARFTIKRDQVLFWKIAEGGLNWNGTFTELRAFDKGRAHVWTPCRPPLDALAAVSHTAVVPSFSPYAVLLSSNLVADTVEVIHGLTKATIPSTDYTVNPTTGVVSFAAAYASQPVVITYQPRLEWQLSARANVSNVELVVTVGSEPKQTFNLGAAGTMNTLTIQTLTSTDIDAIHVTARVADDSQVPFIVELGDWVPRGRQTSAVRYTITTAANRDYDWASSGLLFKVCWPTIELLKARLDGESLFARYLDNGRLVL
jgi:hypothetical protein